MQKFTPGVKILESKANRKNEDFPKRKNLHESLELRHFGGGNFFWEGGGYKFRDRIFRQMEMLVFEMIIVFLTFLRLG